MSKFVRTYLTVFMCCTIHKVLSQNLVVPPIACPQYFEYLCYGNICIGKITLPNVQSGTTTLEVEFTQRNSVLRNYYGNLSLFDDQDTTINKIARRRPISYRVDFPLPNELPKLTELAVNGRVICSASSYPPPSTTVSLEHKITTSVQTISTPIVSPIDDGFNTIIRRPIQIPSFDDELPSDFRNPIIRPVRPRPVVKNESMWPIALEPKIQPVILNGRDVCGQEGEEPVIVPYINAGEYLRPGQFPWLTAIYRKTVGSTSFICGGSLISARTVLSAAHCFQLTQLKAESITVSLGRHNLTSSMESSAVSRDIETLLINPEYDPKSYQDADVALLIMVAPVSFTQFIKPICLWAGPEDFNLVINLTGFVAGWGGDANGNTISPIPKVAPANIVSESVCRSSSELLKVILTSRTFCAGQRDGVGPCMGDSGGGLMIKQSGRWYLRGIVSAGQTENSRCDSLQYVVYCDVVKYNSWVRRELLD